MTSYKAPRGAADILPPDSEVLTRLEEIARDLFDRYGYRRIETPAFEQTEVFQRGIGAASEIVLSKQMYTFTDRRDRSFSLRPEATAGIARAVVEHDLTKREALPVRLYTMGWMFRYERPQKARTRQFHQINAECVGSAEPVVDAELILLAHEFFEPAGLSLQLLLNSMGCAADRKKYGEVLRAAMKDRVEDLCDDCHERLKTNPLRVFDCKVPKCRKILRGGDVPPITEWLCDDCKAHYRSVQEILETLGIAWKDDPYLVRGLDYYTRTVFEFEASELGARATVCAGGRYDGLIEQLGGPPTPAAGFAIGTTATIEALGPRAAVEGKHPDVYVAWMEGLASIAMATSADLRRAGLRVTMSDAPRSLRAQMRAADKVGATRALILGADEMTRSVATVRELGSGDQREIALDQLVAELTP